MTQAARNRTSLWPLILLGALLPLLPPAMAATPQDGNQTLQKTPMQRAPASPPRINPKAIRAIQPQQQDPGGTGIYVLDNVDFNPVGGSKIPGLKWNNQVPVKNYYHYENNSYLIISGTVHGDGLISGPGKDGWTFTVRLDDTDILSGRPSQCIFARSNKPQTTPDQTGWKYQVMFIFKDTRTKPECFNFFKSLGHKPIKVRWADIIGPYWTGEKKIAEPRERLYKSGPMLPLNTDVTSGYDAQLW